jgi:nifR3 family TIM-barrel protein
MAGITDRQFRRVLRRIGGVGIVTMEFVSADGAVRGDERARRVLRFREEERPISIQIYGSDPRTMADAARIVEQVGADICDINMGCPANKILKGCRGAALMDEPDLVRRIVAEVRSAVAIPVSVKLRLGRTDDRMNFLEIGAICEGEGADAVALHGRTARQMFRGSADWDRIAQLKRRLGVPVLGNGDIGNAQEAVARLRESGCDGVLVGRAAIKNPWIFRQAADLLLGRVRYEPTVEERRRLILDHFRMVVDEEDPQTALHKLRTFTGWYTHGLPDGGRLRSRIQEFSSVEVAQDAVEAFFATRSTAA